VAVATLVLLVLATLLSLAVGARPVSPAVLLDAWTAFDPADGDQVVVRTRLPRTVVGMLAGSALGLGGAAMQGLARNPLADPGILGVTAGAALGVVLGLQAGVTGPTGQVWCALVGAGLAAAAVYAVACLGGARATPLRLTLAGAAVGAGLAAVTNALLISSRQTLDSFRFWQVGSLAGRGWDVVQAVLPFLVVGAATTLAAGALLNGLALGDDVARSLGQRVGWGRAATALGVVVLCGGATALAGPMLFAGLVVPHLVRGLVGPDYRRVLPLSLLATPVLVLAADVLGRVVLPPGEVEAGVVTAVLGAPLFVWVVRRGRVAAW
jgi:iron complex transport system permease protein